MLLTFLISFYLGLINNGSIKLSKFRDILIISFFLTITIYFWGRGSLISIFLTFVIILIFNFIIKIFIYRLIIFFIYSKATIATRHLRRSLRASPILIGFVKISLMIFFPICGISDFYQRL